MGSLQKLSREHTHIHTDARTPYSGDGGSGSGSGSGDKEEEQQGGEKERERGTKKTRPQQKKEHALHYHCKEAAGRAPRLVDRQTLPPTMLRSVRSFVRSPSPSPTLRRRNVLELRNERRRACRAMVVQTFDAAAMPLSSRRHCRMSIAVASTTTAIRTSKHREIARLSSLNTAAVATK